MLESAGVPDVTNCYGFGQYLGAVVGLENKGFLERTMITNDNVLCARVGVGIGSLDCCLLLTSARPRAGPCMLAFVSIAASILGWVLALKTRGVSSANLKKPQIRAAGLFLRSRTSVRATRSGPGMRAHGCYQMLSSAQLRQGNPRRAWRAVRGAGAGKPDGNIGRRPRASWWRLGPAGRGSNRGA